MPRLIDYPTTLETLQRQGLKSLYYNSGAFGFQGSVSYVGWIGPEDATLRPQIAPLATQVPPPYPPALTALCLEAWERYLAGVVWVMPMSHWPYELDFGSRDWMPAAVRALGLDPDRLQELTTGNAIEFMPGEGEPFAGFLRALLENLRMSDFMLAFPGRPVLCTVHHHQQLWWASDDSALLGKIRGLTTFGRR